MFPTLYYNKKLIHNEYEGVHYSPESQCGLFKMDGPRNPHCNYRRVRLHGACSSLCATRTRLVASRGSLLRVH